MTTYRGFTVLDTVHPSRDGEWPVRWDRAMAELDARTGKRTVDDRGGAPRISRGFTWWCSTRQELAALKAWLATCKGRAVPFWVPTFQDDLVLAGTTVAANSTVTIMSCGYQRHLYPHAARRHLAFMPRGGGAWTLRRVTDAVDNGDGTETLTLNSAIGGDFTTATTMVSFLQLVRLGEDVVEIEYWSAVSGAATLPLLELRNEVTA